MRLPLVVSVALFFASMSISFSQSQERPQLNLMPMPQSVRLGTGTLAIDQSFSVAIKGYTDARLARGVNRYLDDLRRQTGMLPLDMKVVTDAPASLIIHCDRASKEIQELGEDESYSLAITASGATLKAPNPLGIFHGLQTFLQLVSVTPTGFAVPSVTIEDKPRFPWRGLMIDSGRHFIPLDVIKRNLDGMAAVKLNVFHWHLSENQGFRIESKKFPKLHELGSDGLYYTQAEVRDIIAYARDRGIRVIPEFDMPGHTTAWFVGHPELASATGPYQIERKWGVFDPAMDPTQEHTYKFLDKFIGEMAKLFPDQFFHIGGDEVNGKQWDANPKIQEFMRFHQLKNNQDLQAYFNEKIQKIVSKHGKTMLGWDEILRPDLPKSIVIQSWRGQESLGQAAKQRYRGLLSAGFYLDLMQPASQHYAVDPLVEAPQKSEADNPGSGAPSTTALTDEEKARILGGEACMWAEYVSPENVDSRIWPRTAAIAERLWSPEDVRDILSMYSRLDATSRWLEWLGLTHNSSYDPMLRRIAGTEDIGALGVLTDVVEPVKGYTREETATIEPTALMPLNRVVDAARPESSTARHFAELVNLLLSGQGSTDEKQQIRQWLMLWRDNQARLQPLESRSPSIKEVAPLSQNLSTIATAGIQAMDYIERGETSPDSFRTEQTALIQQAAKPQAQLLIMIAPSVQKLIDRSAGPSANPQK
ncbi:MAG: hexosaminidase [Acidobacteriaceae bacterium]|jgi:hexosaminidase